MPGIYECLEWIVTEQPKHPLDLTYMKAKFAHLDANLLGYAESNIYAILSSYTAGEAKSLVRQARRPNGMEAFRLLQTRFNPVTIGRQRAHLMKIANPQESISLEKLSAEVISWENRIVDYEARPNAEKVSDAMKMAALIHMAPPKLREHLQLNAGRFVRYLDLREEVFSYLDQVTPASHTTMDIGSISKSGGCYNCGGPHLARDCPKPKSDKGKGKKGKGGKDGGGKGKSKGKFFDKGKGKKGGGKKGDGKQNVCSNCGKSGHTYDACWSKPKPLNAVDPKLAEMQSAYAKAALEDYRRLQGGASSSSTSAPVIVHPPSPPSPQSPKTATTAAHVGSLVIRSLCALSRRALDLSREIFRNSTPACVQRHLIGEDEYEPGTPAESDAEQGVFELGNDQEVRDAVASGDLHAEHEEVPMRMGQATPFKPSEAEVAEHCISHVPYRDWCVHCVRGRGRAQAHRRKHESDVEKGRKRPMVHMDYFYLGARAEETLPLLAMLDESSGRMFSLTMPCKGVEHQYCVAAVVKLMRCLGLQDAVIKSDTERSLVALRTAVQGKLPGVGCEDAVKGESASNGAVEAAVGRLQGQARTLKSCLEEHYNFKIPAKHPVLCWLVDYAGTLISRFLRGPDGRTAFERSTGRPWRIRLPEFGECVLYQPLRGEREPKKIEPRFELGVYLGVQEGTAMRWIGTAEGTVRTWTIKRLPEEEKWQKEILEAVIGLPWQLRPSVARDAEAQRLPVEIVLPEVEDEPKPAVETKKRGYVPRGIYVRRDVELRDFGYTEGCDGCERAKAGLSHRQHSSACKQRIMHELNKTEEGRKRVQQMESRGEKYLVAFHEREERKKRAGDGESGNLAKSAKQQQAEAEMEQILGPIEEIGASGQGALPAVVVDHLQRGQRSFRRKLMAL